jgi:hypothetical protein
MDSQETACDAIANRSHLFRPIVAHIRFGSTFRAGDVDKTSLGPYFEFASSFQVRLLAPGGEFGPSRVIRCMTAIGLASR